MLAKPTSEELLSLQELGRRSATAPAVAYLVRNLETLRGLNETELKTKVLRQRQGECITLSTLIKHIRGPQSA